MLHGRTVVTVEGLDADGPHPAQQALVDALGSQCGYCTPGVAMALFEATYREPLDRAGLDDQLCGNLCRCTGYRPIRDAAVQVNGLAPDIPIQTVFRGVAYFMLAYVVCIALMWFVPDTVLYLPRALLG